MSNQKSYKRGIYVSTVVETDGPVPGPYSLRAVGAVAVNYLGETLSSFETCITRLSGASMHPDNERYWKRQRNIKTYQKIEENAIEPLDAISHLTDWTSSLPGQPILVAYQSAFTWMWVHWYCTQYSERSPFTSGPLDLKSQADPFLKPDFLATTKADLPESWRTESTEPDSVVIKAKKQAYILMSLINAKRTLSTHFDLPAWTRETFGPSVIEAKDQARATRPTRPSRNLAKAVQDSLRHPVDR